MPRKRLQIDLGIAEQRAFEQLRGLGAHDADIGRLAVALLARLAAAIGDGFTIVAVPADEQRFADALPELTNAVAPERRFRHLVRLPHPWRRQLSIKGRRLTVGQLVGQMRANEFDAETVAREFDLPVAAVLEALDYAESHSDLLRSESAEERRSIEHAISASD